MSNWVQREMPTGMQTSKMPQRKKPPLQTEAMDRETLEILRRKVARASWHSFFSRLSVESF
jgi:hypothetical protein